MQTDRQIRAASLFLSIIFILLCFPHTVGVYAETTETKYYSVQDYSYEVSLTVISTWQDHANIDLTISNNGNTPIEDWYLTFNSPYQIENIWNASVVEAAADGTCTIKNAGYNQDILPNSQVTVGMTLSSVEPEIAELSSWYLLNMKEAEVDEDKYSFTYIEYSSWGAGFSGAFILSSNETIEDWSVEFESDYQITNVSNAVISSEGYNYNLKNDGNTQNIYPDNPITISIQGIPAENDIINNCVMKNIVLAYSLTEDINENGVPDYQDFINEQEGIISVNPTDVPTDTPTITDEPTPTVEEPDYYLDSDEDMLTDYVEEFYGTDKNDPDSDDDNLSDYFEIIMGYDPNNGDSDDNGIPDGDEDYDNDGITNSEEIRLGIEPQMEDSDLDELSDYDEIYVYGSDPASEDSNNDGITDGDAVFLGLDPVSEDSDGNGIPDNQEKIYQDISTEISEIEAELDVIKEVKVEGDITNRIDTVLTIENVYGKHEYSSDVPAQVGVPINIECESDFGELTVTFYYDETKLGQTREEDLGIYWVDEESGMLVDVDSEVDTESNKVSFVTDHLCDWILIDKKADREFWMGTAKYFNVKTDPAKSVTREGTIYFLAVQFGNLVSDENKTNTMSAIADLMGYIGEEDRVVVYAYNSSNVRDQYNYLIFGDWIEEDGIQVTKFYKKEESGDLLLHLHNLFFGDYKENYYANLMTENGNDGKEIDYENYWYLESNRIEPEKEALASETATNIIHRLFWMHSSCQFRIKLHDSDASSKEKDAYDRSLKEKYSESDDYYFHIKDHENVFVIFANGKQMFTTDIESPVEADGLHYISKADLIENELFIVNTGKTEEKSVLDLNQAMYKVEKGYEYGVWPYTHGCLINMDGTDFGSEFKRMREGLDEDRDGLSDIYEKTGMLGANGKLITSNPDKSDSDGDSLTDGREMGKEYTIVLESVYNKETGKYTSKMEVNGVPVEYGFNGKRYDRFFKYGEGVWTLYSYKSDPELEDTDGDYYFDQYDSKPLKNCIETYDLGGGDFNPIIFDKYNLPYMVKNPEGYIHIIKEDIDYYGGNQSWFSGDVKKLEISSYEEEFSFYNYLDRTYALIKEGGCGLIALNDVLLYVKHGSQILDYETKYREDFFELLDKCENHNFFNLKYSDGTTLVAPAPISCNTVSEVLGSEGFDNKLTVLSIFNTEAVLKKIKGALSNYKPIILNEFFIPGLLYNEYKSNSDEDKQIGIPMYLLNPYVEKGLEGRLSDTSKEISVFTTITDDKVETVAAHYVTITGILIDNNDFNGEEIVWLRVQSWGSVYYIKYSDFVDFNVALSGLGAKGTAIIID